jgi:hypothetical protein
MKKISVLFLVLIAVCACGKSEKNTTAEPSNKQKEYGTWYPISMTGAPSGGSFGFSTSVWTGTEMIVWPGRNGSGGRYDPLTDSWKPTSLINAPKERFFQTAVWTGNEMIVWGGAESVSIIIGGFPYPSTGGRYNPSTDIWQHVSTANAPVGRVGHTAVWTGKEMIIWGGEYGLPGTSQVVWFTNTGGRYNPVSDTWTEISISGAPVTGSLATSIWTGTEMIVWPQQCNEISPQAGRYNPFSNTWREISSEISPRYGVWYNLIWTGYEMIVYGDDISCGRYNPVSNAWIKVDTAEVMQFKSYAYATAVWTGTEMIIWGGFEQPQCLVGDCIMQDVGKIFNPSTNVWRVVAQKNAPHFGFHSAAWTGKEMIVWSMIPSGGRFVPE